MNGHEFCVKHQTSICVCFCNYDQCGQCQNQKTCAAEGLEKYLDKLIETANREQEFDEDELDMERECSKGELAQGNDERKTDDTTTETLLSPNDKKNGGTENRQRANSGNRESGGGNPNKRPRTGTSTMPGQPFPTVTTGHNQQTLYVYLTNTSSRRTRPGIFRHVITTLGRNYKPNHLTIQSGQDTDDYRTYITETISDVLQVLLNREDEVMQTRIMIPAPWQEEAAPIYYHIRPKILDREENLDATLTQPPTTATATTTIPSSSMTSTSKTNVGGSRPSEHLLSTPSNIQTISTSSSLAHQPTSPAHSIELLITLQQRAEELQKFIRHYNRSVASTNLYPIACVTVSDHSIKLEQCKKTSDD